MTAIWGVLISSCCFHLVTLNMQVTRLQHILANCKSQDFMLIYPNERITK